MFKYLTAVPAAVLGLVLLLILPVRAAPLPQVMVVGVAHLVRKRDLHNSTWGTSIFSPGMQQQIVRIVDALAKFKPTKVMIEAPPDDPIYILHYQAYRRGTYRLGGDEDDQFGYRLAGMLNLPTIYPIDSTDDFSLNYQRVLETAARLRQTSLVKQANAEAAMLFQRSSRLEKAGNLVGTLRYLNTPAALKANAGWYMYLDLVGNGSREDAGQMLVGTWYARNLQIFAYIARSLKPGDRAVVFIGQGHAAMLRPMIAHSPFLTWVDPEAYLPVR